MNLIYSLHKSFELNAKRNAFCIDDKFYSYQDLLDSVIKVRKIITSNIDVIESNIGLVINDDLETYATIFGLWMEGKAYVPVNPIAPKTRNLEILNAIIYNSSYIMYHKSLVVSLIYLIRLHSLLW